MRAVDFISTFAGLLWSGCWCSSWRRRHIGATRAGRPVLMPKAGSVAAIAGVGRQAAKDDHIHHCAVGLEQSKLSSGIR
jgi:hypothetical protein